MRFFIDSLIVSVVCFPLAFWWGMNTSMGGGTALFLAALLAVLEVSLSFDNAVVNASVLKHMDAKWQRRFMTWGMLIAVFGMRVFFPLLIVALAAGLGFFEVGKMALQQPELYAQHLQGAHTQIAAFGGMFLLLVFLSFILDEAKEVHWIERLERKLSRLGKLESIEVATALLVLFGIQFLLPQADRLLALEAGIFGIILFVMVDAIGEFMGGGEVAEGVEKNLKYAGFGGFMYLEVLDTAFSFDGVIGAFAVASDIVVIMLGLTIGAMFVRSLTVYLVRKGTLDAYIFLEHGAHYAIGALAFIMLFGTLVHIPEVVTGLVGVAFIGLSVWSSVRYRRKLEHK